jgi:hypothetical protein
MKNGNLFWIGIKPGKTTVGTESSWNNRIHGVCLDFAKQQRILLASPINLRFYRESLEVEVQPAVADWVIAKLLARSASE